MTTNVVGTEPAGRGGHEAVAAASLRGIGKRYGNVVAVADASLEVAQGTVHALVGANGAGKSTLGRILAGATTRDAGEIRIGGTLVEYRTPRDARTHRVALIAQELALAPDMSVVQNVFLGVEPRHLSVVDYREMRRRFTELVKKTGMDVPPDRPVRELSIADRQKVEVLRAVGRGARVIVMDEPTSSLTPDEVRRLHALMRDLRADGVAIVYVSHFLEHVLDIADTITVMRNGRIVHTLPAAAETEQSIVSAMLGHDVAADYPPRVDVGSGETVLEVEGLTRAGAIIDVSFEVRAGEIVGLAGLVGSGRSEILRAVYGVDPIDSGTVTVAGTPLAKPTARSSMAAGMAFVPEDRKLQGLFLLRSAAANTTVSHHGDHRVSRFGTLRRRRENAEVQALLSQLAIKPASPRAGVATMSGGNQQKVLLGRGLFGNPRVLLLDEPTRGVDIGARVAIHKLIGRLARQGMAIVLVSSEIEEVLALAHRVLVIRKGRIAAELGADPSMESVMQAAFGLAEVRS